MENLFKLLRMDGQPLDGFESRDYKELLILFDKKIRHFGEECKNTNKKFFTPKRKLKQERKETKNHEENFRIQK